MKGSLIVLVGLPGSGKSHWANARLSMEDTVLRHRVNWDELRLALGFTTFNRTQEDIMQRESFLRVWTALDNGATEIIVDNTNLNPSARGRWKFLAEQNGLEYEEMFFDAPTDLCVQRDGLREGKAHVGRAVIERMALFAGMIEIPHSPSLGAKNLVILDIDGTIADLEHRRKTLQPHCKECGGRPHPIYIRELTPLCPRCKGSGHEKKDWYTFYSKVSQDTLIRPIYDLAAYLRIVGYRILIVSGRPISWGDLETGKETVTWLKKHGVIYDHIFMRNGGDGRQDTLIKQEILDKLPKERIAYVLDDRDSVVKMWRSNGLTCLQVAEGNF